MAETQTGEEKNHERGAGILLHITSLPSPFGIGDLGPESFAFADFLSRSGQKFWQLLPINPTEQGQAHSPYSSISSMAGNTLLISPEVLAELDLLNADELGQYYLQKENKTDYEKAEHVKKELFEKAWNNFQNGHHPAKQYEFKRFCEAEADWLDDFALYMVLKKQHDGRAWFQWPDEFKLRDKHALHQVKAMQAEALEKVKWLQFMFFQQWHNLKTYCNNLGIQLLGDLPIYVSYDSVDVWSHRNLFCLDEEGNMTGIAGVPPDFFSQDGQLWGMPVYRWDVLKEHKYDWWIRRLQKNTELFDLLRLDHFRAFSEYWHVPANEKTARNGTWQPSPGADLFQTVQQKLGKLPFVAEDLGDINDAVYKLRDDFGLPGMVVLQFAFGGDMPRSLYTPHNYSRNSIAYTGTHDNNTVRGWYRQDADDDSKRRLQQYVGHHLSDDNIHIVLSRMAYGSVAKTVILPMQDVLGLDEHARMNTPASTSLNWGWRLLPGQLTQDAETQLKEWVILYNRQ